MRQVGEVRILRGVRYLTLGKCFGLPVRGRDTALLPHSHAEVRGERLEADAVIEALLACEVGDVDDPIRFESEGVQELLPVRAVEAHARLLDGAACQNVRHYLW